MSMRSFFILVLSVFGLAAVATAQADPRYGGGSGGEVECRSNNFGHQRCPVPWRDARLVRQLSNTQCVRGRTWGIDRNGLWVDHGCVGRFVAAGGRVVQGGRGWQPGADWNRRFSVGCSSNNYQYTFCAVDLGGAGRAHLERQTSNSACIEGRTWGSNRAGIWVNQGCGGVFTIDRRWR
jgi:hypothetical protein